MFEKYLREQWEKEKDKIGISFHDYIDHYLKGVEFVIYGNKAMEELVEKTELTQIALLEESKNN